MPMLVASSRSAPGQDAAERVLLERAKDYRFLRAYNPKTACTQVGFAFESFWLVLGRHTVTLIGRY